SEAEQAFERGDPALRDVGMMALELERGFIGRCVELCNKVEAQILADARSLTELWRVLVIRGEAHRFADRFEAARTDLEQALSKARDRHDRFYVRAALARLAEDREELDVALVHYAEAEIESVKDMR